MDCGFRSMCLVGGVGAAASRIAVGVGSKVHNSERSRQAKMGVWGLRRGPRMVGPGSCLARMKRED